MLKHARALLTVLLTPIATFLLRIGLTPNAVTIIGTIGVCTGALALYPTGHLLAGTLVIVLFVFSDLLDGLMARLTDTSSSLGGFLDSVCDRIQDSAVFLGILLFSLGSGNSDQIGVAAALCMVLGLLVSYIRARAESEGYDANTGIAERPERIVVALACTGAVGTGAPDLVLLIGLTVLAIGSVVSVIQRLVTVVRQARAAQATTQAPARQARA